MARIGLARRGRGQEVVGAVLVKEAVLGLVVERRGYGYDLVQRFNGRFGSAWQLNVSSVYNALDALETQQYVKGRERAASGSAASAPRRYRKVVYEATPKGEQVFRTWLTAPVGAVDPMRSTILLKIGLAGADDALPLLGVLDAQINATTDELADQLAAYELDPDVSARVDWDVAARYFLHDAVISRLQSDLGWLRRVRAAVEELRGKGRITLAAYGLR